MKKMPILLALVLAVIGLWPYPSHAAIDLDLDSTFRQISAYNYTTTCFNIGGGITVCSNTLGVPDVRSTDSTGSWDQFATSTATRTFGLGTTSYTDTVTQDSTIGLDASNDTLAIGATGSVWDEFADDSSYTFSKLQQGFTIDSTYRYTLDLELYTGSNWVDASDGFSLMNSTFTPNTSDIIGPGSYTFGVTFFDIDATYHPEVTTPLGHIPSYYDTTYYLNFALVPYTQTNPVPEPSTMLLMGSGLAGLLGYGKMRRRK